MAKDIAAKDTKHNPYQRWDYPPVDQYLEHFIENWERKKDNIAFFFGAGASSGAVNKQNEKLLNGYNQRNKIWEEFILSKEERGKYDFSNLSLTSLEHAASIAKVKVDEFEVNKLIINLYYCEKTLWQHAVIPFFKPKALFTTNYDNLIEKGYICQNRDYVPLFGISNDPNKNSTPLYKPHGCVTKNESASIRNGGIVISHFDYFDVYNEREKMLQEFIDQLKDKLVIFIGYAFNDFDISRMLFETAKEKGRQTWYTVFPRNDVNIRDMYRDKYGIKQINRTFFDFIYDVDKALNIIPDDWKFDNLDESRKALLQGF